MRPRIRTVRSSLLGLHEVIFKVQYATWYTDDAPPLTNLEKMVLALEDRRFFNHSGIDWIGVLRECQRAITGRRFGGASTIDMQLFRTASNRYERTFRRKGREWIGVLILQSKFSKLEMLRAYLEIAYFGTELRGGDEASMAVYNKPAGDLTLAEASFIASMLVYPKPRLANENWLAKVTRRANYGQLIYPSAKKSFDQVPS